MRPKTLTITMAAADRDGICQAQSAAGAGSLTLNGALAGVMDVPRHVSVYAAGDNSGVTFTITGTDRDNKVMTEDITGPNATTVKGTKNFKTVTGVAVGGATTGNVEVGSADEMEIQWIPLDFYRPHWKWNVSVSTGANLSWTLQKTFWSLFEDGFHESDSVGIEEDGPYTDSRNNDDDDVPVGVRLKIESFVSGTVALTIIVVP